MATTHPTPNIPPQNTVAYTTPPNSHGNSQYNAVQQNKRQQYSPTASYPQTPAQTSPASPSLAGTGADYLALPLAKRHQHQASSADKSGDVRVPYLPAALRPTDPPPRSHPLTPPRSAHGSTDSLDKKGHLSRPVSRRSTTDPNFRRAHPASDLLSHLPEAEVTLALTQTSDLPTVSGPPTRSGWKLDSNAPICDYATCSKSFGLFERRHHCRSCGNVFCNEHSCDRIPLDQNADFHPKGEEVRACAHCANKWIEWVKERARKLNEGEADEDNTRPTDPVGMKGKAGGVGDVTGDGHKGASLVAGSISMGGDWSTF